LTRARPDRPDRATPPPPPPPPFAGAWERLARVRLRHAATRRALWTSRDAEFNARNCPGRCPISGQLEVASADDSGSGGRRGVDESTLWIADEGAFLWKK